MLKLTGSGLAIYWVLIGLDLSEIGGLLKQANWAFLFVAMCLFVAGQILSAFRLNLHFKAIDVELSQIRNLRLYVLGMFYNLFLPGGIGGDGYKVYWLRRNFQAPVSSSIQALLLDRINGLIALLFLLMLGLLLTPLQIAWLPVLAMAGVLLIFPVSYGILRRWFRVFTRIFWHANLLSLAVQILQVLCVFAILISLGEGGQWISYGIIFLLSSVAAVIPISIGGLGVRELVFLFGANYLGLPAGVSVSVSLVFYAITAFVSLFGIIEMVRGR